MFKKSFFLTSLFVFFSFFVFSEQTSIDNATLSTPQDEIVLGNEIEGYDAGNTDAQKTDEDTGSSVLAVLEMIFVLAIVVGIIYAISRFFKKSMTSANNDDPFLRQVSRIILSPGKTVQVVTLLDKAYLIGVTDNNISLLGEIEDKELVNSMNLYSDKKSNTPKPRTFAEILNIFMPGSSKKTESVFSGNITDSSDFLKKQRDRLNGEN